MEPTKEELTSYIDKLTKLNFHSEFNIKDKVFYIQDPEAMKYIFHIRNEMVNFGYIEIKNGFICVANETLKEVRREGGHIEYQKQLQENKLRKKQIEDANYELTVSALKINKYALKTRWISIVSFLISLVALIYAIMTYYTD